MVVLSWFVPSSLLTLCGIFPKNWVLAHLALLVFRMNQTLCLCLRYAYWILAPLSWQQLDRTKTPWFGTGTCALPKLCCLQVLDRIRAVLASADQAENWRHFLPIQIRILWLTVRTLQLACGNGLLFGPSERNSSMCECWWLACCRLPLSETW